MSIEINFRRTGIPEIRSVCGEQVFHDVNDWPQFMNNYSVSGWGESQVCSLLSSFYFTVVFGSHTVLLLFTSVFVFLLFLCILFCCLVSFYLCFVTLPFGVIFFIDSFCLFVFLPSFFFVLRRTPLIAPPGFLSWLLALHKLKKWYICYKSIVKHWARHLVQSEPHSITQISHRASALATHRRTDSRLAGALISQTCFSRSIRAVSRSGRWG